RSGFLRPRFLFAVHGAGGDPARLAPAGDAQVDGEVESRFRLDLEDNLAVPGVLRLLGQLYLASLERNGCRACQVKHGVDLVVAVSVDALAHAGNVAHQVRRTARTIEPRYAMMLALAAERVDVEELVAGQGDSGEQTVVNFALQHVGVLALAAHQ